MPSRWTVLLLISVCILPVSAYAGFRINEVYPAPSSGTDEWVELYNNSDTDASLDGLMLTDAKGNTLQLNGGTVPAYGTVVALSKSILNNDGDTVFLKNAETIIDSVMYTAGLNASVSYTYCPTRDPPWIAAVPTRNTVNDGMCEQPSATPVPTVTVITPDTNLNGLMVSEIMASPEADSSEWIELHNRTSAQITGDIHVDDGNDAGNPLPAHISVAPDGYAIIEMPSDIFNNDGDSVRIDSEGTALITISYPALPKGFTWGITADGSACIMPPSKGEPNNACRIPTAAPSPTSTKIPSPTRTPTKTVVPTLLSTLRSATPSATTRRLMPSFRIVRTVSAEPQESPAGEVKGASQQKHDSHRLPITLLVVAICLAAIAGTITVLRIKNKMGGY